MMMGQCTVLRLVNVLTRTVKKEYYVHRTRVCVFLKSPIIRRRRRRRRKVYARVHAFPRFLFLIVAGSNSVFAITFRNRPTLIEKDPARVRFVSWSLCSFYVVRTAKTSIVPLFLAFKLDFIQFLFSTLIIIRAGRTISFGIPHFAVTPLSPMFLFQGT